MRIRRGPKKGSAKPVPKLPKIRPGHKMADFRKTLDIIYESEGQKGLDVMVMISQLFEVIELAQKLEFTEEIFVKQVRDMWKGQQKLRSRKS